MSTKLHLRVEGAGRPLVILATPGQRHEVTQLEALLNAGAVKRSGPDGRPGRVSHASGQPRWSPTRAMGSPAPGGCDAAAASGR